MTAKITKRSTSAPAAGYKNESVNVAVPPGTTSAEFAAVLARTLTQPETSAASVIERWQKDTHDVNALAAELGKQVEAVNRGDLRRAEGLLIAQAHTLDNVFTILARRATDQQYLPHWEAFMRMAMKAQNQCRMTLETLATIKNPPVVFAKQANINNGGQQQVNNGTSTPASERAGETVSRPNELLEDLTHGRTQLDTRATAGAGRKNRSLVPVGALNRAAKR